MEPNVALTTAPTAKLLWAEMLRTHKEEKMDLTRVAVGKTNIELMKSIPGNPHTNVIGQGYDGADGDSELDVRAGKPVVFVNVSDNHGDDHQRKEV